MDLYQGLVNKKNAKMRAPIVTLLLMMPMQQRSGISTSIVMMKATLILLAFCLLSQTSDSEPLELFPEHQGGIHKLCG